LSIAIIVFTHIMIILGIAPLLLHIQSLFHALLSFFCTYNDYFDHSIIVLSIFIIHFTHTMIVLGIAPLLLHIWLLFQALLSLSRVREPPCISFTRTEPPRLGESKF
jgi:hypothetical protein